MSVTWKDYAGMSAAPVVWAASPQLGQILPYNDCLKQTSSSLIVVGASLLLGLAGVAVSWFEQNRAGDRAQVFVARLSIGIGLAFTFALTLQGAATLLLNPCQH
jgi:hypothetical protein